MWAKLAWHSVAKYIILWLVGRLYVGMASTQTRPFTKWNGSEIPNATVVSLFRQITGSTSVSLPYKTLKVCKIHGYNDIWKSATPPFRNIFSSSSSSVRTTYLKIGASICRGSFTEHLHLGACMILDAPNRLSWLNTLQSRYYIRGLCGGRHFLTVASRDPCAAERG